MPTRQFLHLIGGFALQSSLYLLGYDTAPKHAREHITDSALQGTFES
ncbi:hypothetical protein GCM10011591_28340 [Nocardia camponoti]|uniref:Uncharacterized protein n=1 Tax=Nocardia camponoti TaxID=1616106 RepID=A0A917VA57_9NOCA|nr:hypothetical protein GCM10011591_28340 [Nocardia camponoti]